MFDLTLENYLWHIKWVLTRRICRASVQLDVSDGRDSVLTATAATNNYGFTAPHPSPLSFFRKRFVPTSFDVGQKAKKTKAICIHSSTQDLIKISDFYSCDGTWLLKSSKLAKSP